MRATADRDLRSTGVAAVKAGKAFVGIEQNPTHFETACQRIAAALEGTAQ